MDLELIASLIEEAMAQRIEAAIEAVKSGDSAAALENLERAHASLDSALNGLRLYHCPPQAHGPFG
jgi:acetylglutamate kinase